MPPEDEATFEQVFATRQWISDRTEGQTTTRIGDEETSVLATRLLWKLDLKGGKYAEQLRDDSPEGALEKVIELLISFRLVKQE